MTLQEEMHAIKWWHHIDLGPELGVTPGTEPSPRSRDAYLKIPWQSIKGKTVLDIGAWDGLYSFEAEKAGASEVVAMDLWAPEGSSSHTGLRSNRAGFEFARRVLKSKVQALAASVYELDDGDLFEKGFDFVFCFGVLYHLTDPLRGLRGCFNTLKPGGLLILETALDASINTTETIMRFTEKGFSGDPTNHWYPNIQCCAALLRFCGFADVQYTGGIGSRGAFHARRPYA